MEFLLETGTRPRDKRGQNGDFTVGFVLRRVEFLSGTLPVCSEHHPACPLPRTTAWSKPPSFVLG